ncbi:MAG: hypothetical protein R2845_08155 [Thermomicrobiales bacterium]
MSADLDRDATDPLARFRDRFYLPPDALYFDGNSLGLLSKDAEASTLNALDQWKRRWSIAGWMQADPQFTLGEELGARSAALVGAEPDEVVVTGGTTINLHALVSTFYQPHGTRRKDSRDRARFSVRRIRAPIADPASRRRSGNRPCAGSESRRPHHRRRRSDRHAMTEGVALAVLPSVSVSIRPVARYRATHGRRPRTRHRDRIRCAHSAGIIPHTFDADGVDFAFTRLQLQTPDPAASGRCM